jgi:hypothetical protein
MILEFGIAGAVDAALDTALDSLVGGTGVNRELASIKEGYFGTQHKAAKFGAGNAPARGRPSDGGDAL